MIETISEYKQTPIGKIPADWEMKKLGDISLGKGVYGINASAVDYKENLPKYLRITDIDDEGYFSTDKLSSVDDENSKDFYLKNGDLIFVRTGSTTGKSYLYNNKDGLLVYAGFLIKFSIDNKKANDYYIWNYTKTTMYYDWVKKFSQRSGQPGLNSNEYSNLLIPLPPLSEQQKIAEVLSTWDKGIQETGSIIKRLEKRNKALAFSLFQNQNWNNKQLKELFARITDKNIENNKTVTTISAKRGFIKQEDFFNKTVASEVLTNYYLINKGDFCYNKSYSKGYDWGVVKRLNDFEKAVVTTLYICFRLIAKKQNSDFWELYFSSGILDRGLSKIAHEGGRAHGLLNVTSGDFFSLKVAVPSLEEQNKIAEILTTANKELHQYRQKLDNLKTQKKGLMQQLLTGKVRTM